jgi:HAMP domain-containing protein
MTSLNQFLFTAILFLLGALGWFVQNYLQSRSREVKKMRDELEKQKLVTTEIQSNYLTRFEAVNKNIDSVRLQMVATEANIMQAINEKIGDIRVSLATLQAERKPYSED